jgi:hypothetical protein
MVCNNRSTLRSIGPVEADTDISDMSDDYAAVLFTVETSILLLTKCVHYNRMLLVPPRNQVEWANGMESQQQLYMSLLETDNTRWVHQVLPLCRTATQLQYLKLEYDPELSFPLSIEQFLPHHGFSSSLPLKTQTHPR